MPQRVRAETPGRVRAIFGNMAILLFQKVLSDTRLPVDMDVVHGPNAELMDVAFLAGFQRFTNRKSDARTAMPCRIL